MMTEHLAQATRLAQKNYYEERFDAYDSHASRLATATMATNIWWQLRDYLARAEQAVGLQRDVVDIHRAWIGDVEALDVLDLGCFTGNELSLELAGKAKTYTGVDLSEKAVSSLNRRLSDLDRPAAKAIAGDILDLKLPERGYDLVYAKSVLHHFREPAEIVEELSRILRPGGRLITDDPLQTEPINRLARLIYRPFQSDRDWEWPFTRELIASFASQFEIVDVQGVRGFSKFALPFYLVPIGRVGARLGRFGWSLDRRYARSARLACLICWNISMHMRLRPTSDARSDLARRSEA